MPSLGWLPDPVKRIGDTPDLLAGASLAYRAPTLIPAAASQRDLIVNILDQRALGSCVAQAGMQAIRGSHVQQLKPKLGILEARAKARLGSRLFGYYLARATHHATSVDSGTYLRAFFDVIRKFGFPPEASWPYDDSSAPGAKFMAMPSTKAFHDAFDQRRPTAYYRISEYGSARVEAVKQAIARGYLVCFGTQVSNDFASNKLLDVVQSPLGSSIAGGHAMTIVGYDERDVFLIANSWGTSWGAAGFCHFAPEYISWSQSTDFWFVDNAPGYSA